MASGIPLGLLCLGPCDPGGSQCEKRRRGLGIGGSHGNDDGRRVDIQECGHAVMDGAFRFEPRGPLSLRGPAIRKIVNAHSPGGIGTSGCPGVRGDLEVEVIKVRNDLRLVEDRIE